MQGHVIIAGGTGILGSAFVRRLVDTRLTILTRPDLDPAEPDAVRRRVRDISPSLVINCAADTDVETAETSPERAYAVNARLAGALAKGAAEAGAGFVHFSSTGCYGAWKTTPYEETDPLRPTTVHHQSKAAGEDEVLRGHPAALVIRLGWVFGGAAGQRKNFVWARLAEARSKAEIGSDPAQIGCPTSAADIAEQTLHLADVGVTGIINCVGNGAPARRLDYVSAILAAAQSSTRVVPMTFTRRAPVSPNESAVNARLKAMGLDRMPPWRDSLAAFVRSLQSSS
jgi:dTDP-4-dehydrorhamnose reductase